MIVRVRNFQSIEDATLEVRGFTALGGRNNIGKSAFVRAVKAALTGTSSTSFVRHGVDCPRKIKGAKTCKCHCSVHLRGDDFDLLWEKGDAINRYTFNGKVFDKAERGTPDFLQPTFAPVKVGDEKELLQVADQFSPIFLLDQTGGVIADVLSDVAHLDRVNVAIRLSEKDRRDATATRKVREQDVVTLSQTLVRYEGLDDALQASRAVEDRLEGVETAERRYEALLGYIERGSSLERQVTLFTQVLEVRVPPVAPLTQATERLGRLEGWITQVGERAGALRHYQAVEGLPALLSQPLSQSYGQFELLDGWVARIRTFKGWMERLKGLEAVPHPQADAVLGATRRYQELTRLGDQHTRLTQMVGTLDTAAGELRVEGDAIQAEWDALGICPTCVQPFHTVVHETTV